MCFSGKESLLELVILVQKRYKVWVKLTDLIVDYEWENKDQVESLYPYEQKDLNDLNISHDMVPAKN